MAAYLDHNATTPLDAGVLEAMLPFLRAQYGNASSVHRFGRAARAAVDRAREQVAEFVGAQPSEIVFTSGGSEANNTALRAGEGPARLVIGAIEHPSVSEVAARLAVEGWRVDTVPVDTAGRVRREILAPRLATPAALVSVQWANNETGVLNDIASLSAAARERGVRMHTDAVQAAGKVEVDFAACGAHFMSLSAHKIHGPKGVGALVVDKSVELRPLLCGGGQERGRRSGTENVAGIVGFGAAATLARARLAETAQRMGVLRVRLEAALHRIEGVAVVAQDAERLPNTVCFMVDGIDGETLLLDLDRAGYAVSSGSACAGGRAEPSPVLCAMGIPAERARTALRASLGRDNSPHDVDGFVEALSAQVRRRRGAPGADGARRTAGIR